MIEYKKHKLKRVIYFYISKVKVKELSLLNLFFIINNEI